VLGWYRAPDGRPRTREAFLQIARSLETYYGEDYGHCGNVDDLVQIANTCFEENGELIKELGDERSGAEALTSAESNPQPSRRPTPADTLRLLKANAQQKASRTAGTPSITEQERRDALGRTRLWWAVYDNDLEAARRWISRGTNVNAADIDGETPLHCAVRWGRLEHAKLLLWRGADPNARSRTGATPLHLAIRESQGKIVEQLVSRGAAVNAVDAFGCTPLHDAAGRGYSQIAELLLKSGADARLADSMGTTALHRAARSGHAELARRLLAAGADPSARNLLGRTPQDEATQRGFEKLAAALQNQPHQAASRTESSAAPDLAASRLDANPKP
jgi:ankyrin repeat protein